MKVGPDGTAGHAVSTVDGPWVQAFCLEVPLELLSKSNARRYRRGAGPARDNTTFETSLGWLVRASRPEGWVTGDAVSPLAERPAVVVVVAARSLLDAGNFSKSILDALEGVLFVNDASVRAVVSLAERGRSSSFRLGVARLDGSATFSELAAASAALSMAVVA